MRNTYTDRFKYLFGLESIRLCINCRRTSRYIFHPGYELYVLCTCYYTSATENEVVPKWHT